MKPSFKDFYALSLLTPAELAELSEAQLDEQFGQFFGRFIGRPGADLETKKKELLAKKNEFQRLSDLEAERAKRKLRAAADARFAAAKAALGPQVKTVGKSIMVPSGTTSAAAQSRRAELEYGAR